MEIREVPARSRSCLSHSQTKRCGNSFSVFHNWYFQQRWYEFFILTSSSFLTVPPWVLLVPRSCLCATDSDGGRRSKGGLGTERAPGPWESILKGCRVVYMWESSPSLPAVPPESESSPFWENLRSQVWGRASPSLTCCCQAAHSITQVLMTCNYMFIWLACILQMSPIQLLGH